MRTAGAIIFILNALIFNLVYDGQPWLQDLWFVTIYVSVALFIGPQSKNNVLKLAFYLAILRAVYNAGILFGLYKYDLDEKGFGILTGIILVFIITEKWPKQRT